MEKLYCIVETLEDGKRCFFSESLEQAILAEQKSAEEEARKTKQKKFQRDHPGLAARSDYDFNLNAEFREGNL